MRTSRMEKYIWLIPSLISSTVFGAAGSCMVDPIDNVTASSQYGKYRPDYGSVHQGHDLVNPKGGKAGWEGRKMYAASEGEIIFVGFRNGNYGNMIAIKRTNAGTQTGDVVIYKHVRNVYKVKKGDIVKPGQQIGYYSGTKLSATDNSGYAPHLHFEYMTTKDRSQQYEYDPVKKTVVGKFARHGGKGYWDRVVRGLTNGQYYTDPTPYICNDWPMQDPSNTGFRFKTIREQYNFILAKLGKSGFEVGGVPNNVVSGNAPDTGEYATAYGCAELEQVVLQGGTETGGATGSASAPSAAGSGTPAGNTPASSPTTTPKKS